MLIHGRIVLQSAVHQSHDQIELLMFQHRFVSDDVLCQFTTESQTCSFGLQSSQNGRKCLPRIRNLVFEYTIDAVP